MTEPTPPTNVRAVLRDGTEIPLDCRYVGLVDGKHRWEAVYSLPDLPESVLMDELPAHTVVAIRVDWLE
jgi:hypothetical protein